MDEPLPSDDLLVAASAASRGDPVTGWEHLRTGLEVDRPFVSGPNESSVESGSGATPFEKNWHFLLGLNRFYKNLW